jgi:hypothetical protein
MLEIEKQLRVLICCVALHRQPAAGLPASGIRSRGALQLKHSRSLFDLSNIFNYTQSQSGVVREFMF